MQERPTDRAMWRSDVINGVEPAADLGKRDHRTGCVAPDLHMADFTADERTSPVGPGEVGVQAPVTQPLIT